jgi:hypothetical protein
MSDMRKGLKAKTEKKKKKKIPDFNPESEKTIKGIQDMFGGRRDSAEELYHDAKNRSFYSDKKGNLSYSKDTPKQKKNKKEEHEFREIEHMEKTSKKKKKKK